MTAFLSRGHNILPKKELHRSLQVAVFLASFFHDVAALQNCGHDHLAMETCLKITVALRSEPTNKDYLAETMISEFPS